MTWFFFFWITIKFTVNKNVVHLILLNHLVKTYGYFLVKVLGRLAMSVQVLMRLFKELVHLMLLGPCDSSETQFANKTIQCWKKSRGFLQHKTFMKARKSEDQSRRLCEMLKSCSLFADNPALWNIIMK